MSTETAKLPTQILVYGEIAISVLSILIGCWTLEQTRQEKNAKGYKVCPGFCHCSSTWSPLGAPFLAVRQGPSDLHVG